MLHISKYNSLYRTNAVDNPSPYIIKIISSKIKHHQNYLFVTTCDAQQNYTGSYYEV